MHYTENVRAFSLKLHYFSPRGYVFVRNQFNNHLPHPETMRKWYRKSDLDAESGLSWKSLQILKDMAVAMREKQQQLVCSLSFDEMAIKMHQQWCSRTNKFYGGVTYSNIGNSEDIANMAIVFFINGINARIQVPVAYYFIKGLDADTRKTLLNDITRQVLETGVIIANITFDGLPTNASMCALLGADLDPFHLRPFYTEPSKGHTIHIIVDPSHCVKLVRNNLAKRSTLYDVNGDKIEWDFFVKLVKLGQSVHFGMAHKMNKRHIDFKTRIMHVRTAVETLSASVADSLQYLLDNNMEEFAHASATIRFIRIFNHLFDIMNTHRVDHNHSNQFKSALNSRNQSEVFTFLKEAKEYILNLKVIDGDKLVPVVQTAIKTGFRGFAINIESITAMYSNFIEEDQVMSMFPIYRISQDHLEMFFHKIRSRNGDNDNPTVLQFQYSYRRLQMINALPMIGEGNICNISSSNILSVSSNLKKKESCGQFIRRKRE